MERMCRLVVKFSMAASNPSTERREGGIPNVYR